MCRAVAQGPGRSEAGKRAEMTPKQAAFVREYLVDLNATQAAVRAGYSERTAGRIGAENLQKPVISEALRRGMLERSERTEITQDRVVEELARIGFADFQRAVTPDGALRPIREWGDLVAAIASVEVVTRALPSETGEAAIEHVHKVRLWDKMSALDKLGRHLGMWKPRGAGADVMDLGRLVVISDEGDEDE